MKPELVVIRGHFKKIEIVKVTLDAKDDAIASALGSNPASICLYN